MELAPWERLQSSFLLLLFSDPANTGGKQLNSLLEWGYLCVHDTSTTNSPTAGLHKQDVPWDVGCLLGSSYQHMEGVGGDPPLFSQRREQYRLTSTTPTAD